MSLQNWDATEAIRGFISIWANLPAEGRLLLMKFTAVMQDFSEYGTDELGSKVLEAFGKHENSNRSEWASAKEAKSFEERFRMAKQVVAEQSARIESLEKYANELRQQLSEANKRIGQPDQFNVWWTTWERKFYTETIERRDLPTLLKLEYVLERFAPSTFKRMRASMPEQTKEWQQGRIDAFFDAARAASGAANKSASHGQLYGEEGNSGGLRRFLR